MILSTLRDFLTYYDVSCFHILHPKQRSCIAANLDIMLQIGTQSLKVYFVLFLLIRVFQGRFSLSEFSMDVLRSTLFLTTAGTGISSFICLLSKLFGVVYKCNIGFIPTLISSLITFPIESRSRQRILSPFMLSNCVDTIIRVLVSRNLLPSIPCLDVMLFMLVSGRICGRLSASPSTTGFNDSVFALLTNPVEVVGRRFPSFRPSVSFPLLPLLAQSPILEIPLLLTAGCVWGLFIGLSYNIVSMAVKRMSKLLSGSKGESATGSETKRRRGRRFNLSVPAFLASYIGLFMLCKHSLRNMTPISDKLSDSIAGLLAGSAISIYRFPSLSLYLFIKELLSLSRDLMHSGYLPRIPYLNIILYTLACAIQFHCVVFEFENITPSYLRFLTNFAEPILHNINDYLNVLTTT